MKNNNLKEIDGKKFRRQYFTGVIYAILCIMIFVSFVLTILNFMYGKNDIPQLLTDILTAVTVCFFLQIPFIIVAIINRFCFGKIVCVTNEQGMYHENGFIFWSDIARIEYEIGLPSRYNG